MSDFLRWPGKTLTPGGIVYLRTDDEDYFSQMMMSGGSPPFTPVETPDALAGLVTDFEKGFQAHGVKTLRVAYRLRSQ